MTDFFERVAALRREGRPFAIATVVARRAPVSAHLGDRAIVFPDGRMEGFVGGACSREIVRRQALAALDAREGRLVSIRPDAGDSPESTAEHVVVPMTCASEGAVDVYVEPFAQARTLVVVGATPVAAALARLGHTMDYRVVRVVDARELGDVAADTEADGASVVALGELQDVASRLPRDTAVVVASQGHYDEESLEAILTFDLAYVGLVASQKRGDAIRALLESTGARRVASVRSPAGLDLGGRTPAEVALSILAEIVQTWPREPRGTSPATEAPATAVDPVCGMDVTIATARHTTDVHGTTYYFCCAHCRAAFEQNPQAFQAHQTT